MRFEKLECQFMRVPPNFLFFVSSGHVRTVVQLLLGTGRVEINARDAEGRSALAKALQRESLELASLLVGAKAGKSRFAPGLSFCSPKTADTSCLESFFPRR